LFKKGSIVFSEGAAGEAAYLIHTGTIAIIKQGEKGPIVLATVGKSSLFGEMALIDGSRRMAGAMAVEDTVCSMISQAQLNQKLAALKPSARAVFELMIRYVRETLPWEKRRDDPFLAAESDLDIRIRGLVPTGPAMVPADFANDPVLRLLHQLAIDYIRRRLPPRGTVPPRPADGVPVPGSTSL
jgi:CRP-like cAMP-binding protein